METILHGEDLLISVDGVTKLAAKSCEIRVKNSTQKKSSPTSGQWEEIVAGRKNWSVSTNNLIYAGKTIQLANYNIFYLNAFNSATNGWRVLGECDVTVNNSTQTNIIDEQGSEEEGIYVLKILKQTGELISTEYISTAQWRNLPVYLLNNFSSNNYIFVITTFGKYAIDRSTCNTLNETYHISLPFVELGGIINNEEILVDTPLVMMGGKGIDQGMYAYDQTNNVIKATFYNGELPIADSIPGAQSMVGKMCTLRIRNTKDNSILAGQALCTDFNVTAEKFSLMKGIFAWQGNGELETSAFVPTTKDLEKYVNYIMIDMNKSTPTEMITGDINGNILQTIRNSFHRYLAIQKEGSLQICQLSDEDSTKFYDGSDAVIDGTRGDVMVKHITFYTNVQNYGEGKFRIGFAVRNLGAEWMEWNENDMIGAYEGSVTTTATGNTPKTDDDSNGYLRSISGIEPITNVTASYYESKANRMNVEGLGFESIKWRHHNIMGVLLMALYGTTNSQAVCGNGVPMGSPITIAATGGTNSYGVKDTSSGIIGPINFCGIENWWGNVMEYINNIVGGNSWYVLPQGQMGPHYYIDDALPLTGMVPAYISKMAIGENLDLLPTALQGYYLDGNYGSPQLGFCDWYDRNIEMSYTNGIARGGDGADDEKQGAFYLYAGITGESKTPLLGTRLCYQGNFDELTPADYNALFS